jgi:hypothetical protein
MARAGVRLMEARVQMAIVATLEDALAWVAASDPEERLQ